jgi:hypothetical protein
MKRLDVPDGDIWPCRKSLLMAKRLPLDFSQRLTELPGSPTAVREAGPAGLEAYRTTATGRPFCSLLFCAASMKAKISRVSSLATGGLPVWKNFTISITSGR